MKLIMENWRKFLKEEEKHPMLDPRLDQGQIDACKKAGISVMTQTEPVYGKASPCAARGYKTPECGPQVGEFDNEKWCPPGKRCNITRTCVPCSPTAYDSGKNSKYSNCKGDKKLKTSVMYKDPDGVFSIIYDSKDGKIKVRSKEKIHVGHRKFFDARKQLRLAKRKRRTSTTARLGMYQGNM
tara:strand:- start:4487 stop:5035 length:549 start_codon:yes stop_codon:yes gene_type:complete